MNLESYDEFLLPSIDDQVYKEIASFEQPNQQQYRQPAPEQNYAPQDYENWT